MLHLSDQVVEDSKRQLVAPNGSAVAYRMRSTASQRRGSTGAGLDVATGLGVVARQLRHGYRISVRISVDRSSSPRLRFGRVNHIDIGTLEPGMQAVQIFDSKADIRAGFLPGLGGIDVEQQEILRAIGPRSPRGMRMAEAAVFVDLGLSERQSKKVPVEAKRPIKVAYPQHHLDQPSSHVYFLRILDPASATWCSRRSRSSARWYWLDRIRCGLRRPPVARRTRISLVIASCCPIWYRHRAPSIRASFA